MALLFAAPSTASACIFFGYEKLTEDEKLLGARRLIDRADAIVDGEVVVPQGPQSQYATVRAVRVLKGPNKREFQVEVGTSCEVPLTSVGERGRFILVGGPEHYHAPAYPESPELVDRVLGSNRAMTWTTGPR